MKYFITLPSLKLVPPPLLRREGFITTPKPITVGGVTVPSSIILNAVLSKSTPKRSVKAFAYPLLSVLSVSTLNRFVSPLKRSACTSKRSVKGFAKGNGNGNGNGNGASAASDAAQQAPGADVKGNKIHENWYAIENQFSLDISKAKVLWDKIDFTKSPPSGLFNDSGKYSVFLYLSQKGDLLNLAKKNIAGSSVIFSLKEIYADYESWCIKNNPQGISKAGKKTFNSYFNSLLMEYSNLKYEKTTGTNGVIVKIFLDSNVFLLSM